MRKIDKSTKKIEQLLKKETNNNPDIYFKKISFFEYDIMLFFSESLTSRDVINNCILEYLEKKKMHSTNDFNNPLDFLIENIPVSKIVKINTYEDLFYHILSGFTLIAVDGYSEVLALETKASLNSDISVAENETVIKGPKDAFTENYQTNIGLIKKRIKSEKLWIDEFKVGKLSKTKVGLLHVDGIASNEIVEHLKSKIKKINIDAVFDSNYIIETISGNRKKIFPTYLSTERPDLVAMHLLGGKIAIVVENTQLVIVIPALFVELFHSPEDYYQKSINANYTRIIRLLAFLITILTPAIYIAITTYNHEAIPSKLLINFSVQRDGVPFPTIIEALMMLVTFEILKETDTRIPTAIGSSLSIVGALVLGEAAVTAGIVSPIMIIVIAVTSISGLILSNIETINGIRWWRLLFLVSAALAGIVGIVAAGFIFIISLSSIKALGVPYLSPVVPLLKEDIGDSIFVTDKKRFLKRDSFMAKNNVNKGRGESK